MTNNPRRRMKSCMEISNRLSWGLIRFPELIEQFPMIVSSLDQNEYVNVNNIRNSELRLFLENIMQLLPVELNEYRGWSRSDPDVFVGKYINRQLLTAGTVKAPSMLSQSEAAALRWGAPRILHILTSFPDLRTDLSGFLQNLLDGNSVQLDDMDNESLRDELSMFLKAIGLEEDTDGAMGLPTSPGKLQQITECLSHLIYSFHSAEAFQSLSNVGDSTIKPASESKQLGIADYEHNTVDRRICDEGSKGSNSNSNSNTSDSDDKDSSCSSSSSDSDDIATTKRSARVVGPMIPSAAQLNEAQQLTKKYLSKAMIDTKEVEDDFGPSVAPLPAYDKEYLSRTVVPLGSSDQAAPIGFVGLSAESSLVTASQGSGIVCTTEDVVEREEWMMTPGENKTIAELYSATGSMGNRKFQTGKGAKQLADSYTARSADVSAMKRRFGEDDDQIRVTEDDDGSPDAFGDDGRGPSLMEQHLEGLKSKKVCAPVGRQAFDRERDLLSRNKMDSKQAAQLADQAKQLSSRFGKGNTQTRTF